MAVEYTDTDQKLDWSGRFVGTDCSVHSTVAAAHLSSGMTAL